MKYDILEWVRGFFIGCAILIIYGLIVFTIFKFKMYSIRYSTTYTASDVITYKYSWIREIIKHRTTDEEDIIALGMTICNGEVPADYPLQEKRRVYMVARTRAEHCGTSVSVELRKEKMFSAWNGSGLTINKFNIRQRAACIKEARSIITGSQEDGFDANFFHTMSVSPSWAQGMGEVSRSGGHIWLKSSDRDYCRAELPDSVTEPRVEDCPGLTGLEVPGRIKVLRPGSRKKETDSGRLIRRINEITKLTKENRL